MPSPYKCSPIKFRGHIAVGTPTSCGHVFPYERGSGEVFSLINGPSSNTVNTAYDELHALGSPACSQQHVEGPIAWPLSFMMGLITLLAGYLISNVMIKQLYLH